MVNELAFLAERLERVAALVDRASAGEPVHTARNLLAADAQMCRHLAARARAATQGDVGPWCAVVGDVQRDARSNSYNVIAPPMANDVAAPSTPSGHG